MLSEYGRIAALQTVFFVLCLPASLFVLWHHGRYSINRALGWFYFFVFCIIRIAGASLVTEVGDDITSSDALSKLKSAAIMSSAGTTILILGMQGLLHEIGHQYAFKKGFRVCHYIMFTILQLSSIAGMILVIVGGLKHVTAQHKYTLLKTGALLQLHAYVGTVILSLVILFRIKHLPKRTERRLYYATLLAAPFLFVRLLYVVLIVFNSNPTFDFILGNPYVFLGMAVLEEFVIMILVLGAGLITSGPLSDEMARVPEKEHSPMKTEQEQVAYQPTVV